MSKVVIIPARLASTRLPKKLLLPLGGMPLLMRTVQQAKKSRADSVWVATCDQEIAELCLSHGCRVKLSSPAHQSGTDRIAETLSEGDGVEYIVNVQGDEPFIDPQDINILFEMLESGAPMTTLRRPIDAERAVDSNIVKVVCSSLDSRALYFSRALLPHDRDGIGAQYYAHIGVYGFARDTLLRIVGAKPTMLEQVEKLEQLRALELNIPIEVADAVGGSMGIDTDDDYQTARERCASLGESAFP